MTKEQIESLIDRLADKTLSFGCKLLTKHTNEVYTLVKYHPVKCETPYWETTFDGDMLPRQIIDEIMIKESKILGHPILLGDILAKEMSQARRDELVRLWLPCGADKSLQEIVEESGYCEENQYTHEYNCNIALGDVCNCEPVLSQHKCYLKSPEANALFSYLDNLFPKNPTK